MTSKRFAVKEPKATRRASVRVGFREDVRAYKREVILKAAIDVFYCNGYQTATVDDVAALLSMTKAAVYYYFESKEALLTAIIERCSDLTLQAIERGMATGDSPPKRLALACFCFAAMVLENQKMIALYFREERCFPSALRDRVNATEKAVTAKLSRVIETGVRLGSFRECDAQLLALNVTGMISMSFYWYTEHGRMPKMNLCRYFASEALFFAGFKGDALLEDWVQELAAA
jgi:AcrR family transcriptional regulator